MKRPATFAFYSNNDETKRYYHSSWGKDRLAETVDTLKKDGFMTDDMMLNALERILEYNPRIKYSEYDALMKTFNMCYEREGNKSETRLKYEEFTLKPTIKASDIIWEKELLREYFVFSPNEIEIKRMLNKLNHDNYLDDDEDFWFSEKAERKLNIPDESIYLKLAKLIVPFIKP